MDTDTVTLPSDSTLKELAALLKQAQKDIQKLKNHTKLHKCGRKRRDLTGKKFGNLTAVVQGPDYPVGNGKVRTTWVCQCDCGQTATVLTSNLTTNNSTSCGCLKYGPGHGHTAGKKRSPTYATWNAMKTRCQTPSHANYRRYGGKGIIVCKEWQDFRNFLKDMGPRPAGCEIHRLDSNGHYEPGNCEWVDKDEHRQLHAETTREVY